MRREKHGTVTVGGSLGCGRSLGLPRRPSPCGDTIPAHMVTLLLLPRSKSRDRWGPTSITRPENPMLTVDNQSSLSALADALTIDAFDQFRSAVHRADLPLSIINAFAAYKAAVTSACWQRVRRAVQTTKRR